MLNSRVYRFTLQSNNGAHIGVGGFDPGIKRTMTRAMQRESSLDGQINAAELVYDFDNDPYLRVR